MDLERLLESYHHFLTQSAKDKTLNSKVSARYLNLIALDTHLVSADFYAYRERQSFWSENYDKAIESYKDAVSQLSLIRETPESIIAIRHTPVLIREIGDAMLDKHSKDVESQMVGGVPAEGELNQ